MENEGRIRAKRLFPALATSSELELYRPVNDVDEEIFLLYTLYAPEADRLGLGQVNSKNDVLTLTLDLIDPSKAIEVQISTSKDARDEARISSRTKDISSKARVASSALESLVVQIRQNSTNLRSDAGDTGSIIWRSSISLVEKLIRDIGQKRSDQNELPSYLIEPQEFLKCKVLELGSGTGVLPRVLLSYLSDTRQEIQEMMWIATDQRDILPLLRKNLFRTQAIVEELDWIESSNVYQSNSQSTRQALLRDLFKGFGQEESTFPDLVIATDCIFNPSLFGAFVDTLNLCSLPQKTIAMIICELREAEMMSEFLATLLEKGKKGEQWVLHALSGHIVGRLAYGSIVWIGWRSS